MRFARLLTRGGAGALALALGAAACQSRDTAAGRTGDSAAAAGGDTAAGAASAGTGDDIALVQKIAMRSFNGSVEAANAGRQAFLDYNCYGCHGGLAGGAMGPSLRDDEWKFGGTDEQIMNSLENGRPAGMPAWKGVATDQELRNIVVYIRSLRSRQEPTWFFSPTDTTTKAAFLAEAPTP